MTKFVGFTGTRDGMTDLQKTSVLNLLNKLDCPAVNHGDCVGADADFDELAKSLGMQRRTYPSNMESQRAHCERRGAVEITYPADPLVRNGWILGASSCLIATPKEYDEVLRSGTWSTIRKARTLGIPIFTVFRNGEVLKTESVGGKDKT